MKKIIILVAAVVFQLFFSTVSFANECQTNIYKEQRRTRHEEQKKWDQMIEACNTKYPKGFDSKSPDYDARFECREKVEDLKKEFKAKLDEQTCQKCGVCLKK